MEIDFSAADAFRTCPAMYYEMYVAEGTGLELIPKANEYGPLDFGGRIHELQEEYYNELRGTPIPPYPKRDNEALEVEAEVMMAAYRAKYPQEDFEIVDVERPFRVQLPDLCPRCYLGEGIAKLDAHPYVVCSQCGHMFPPARHTATGKIDVTFRVNKLDIMDHKTQNRRSNSNHPKKWAAKDQASIYLWAASKIYKEEIGRFHVNVMIRPSPKLQEPPIFPERMALERTPDQIALAIRNLVVTADTIEKYKQTFGDHTPWPVNTEMCTEGTWGDCEFYLPHTYGWSKEIREQKYQAKTPYLHLGGVPIIQ